MDSQAMVAPLSQNFLTQRIIIQVFHPEFNVTQSNVVDQTVIVALQIGHTETLCTDVFHGDVFDISAVTGKHIDGILHIGSGEIAEVYVLNFGAAVAEVTGLQLDHGTTTMDRDIGKPNVANGAGAHADSDGRGIHREDTIGYSNVFTRFGILQTFLGAPNGNGIVTGIDDTVGNSDVTAAIQVNTVGIQPFHGIINL
jgi:hypothetical protein